MRKMSNLAKCVVFGTVLGGCGANGIDDVADSNDAITLSGRSDPLFAKFPQGAPEKTSDGRSHRLPFYAYDSDTLVLYGTADIAPLIAEASTTGFAPTTTEGGTRGFVHLVYNHFLDSSEGKFAELVVAIDVAQTAQDVPWVNAYSAFVPSVMPTTLSLIKETLVDSRPLIVLERELVGFDASAGSLASYRCDGVRSFEIADGSGLPVLRGSVTEDNSDAARNNAAVGLAAAFGLPGPADLPPQPEFFPIAMVTQDVRSPGAINTIGMLARANPYLTPLASSDRIVIGGNAKSQSATATWLSAAHFQPTLLWRERDLHAVSELPLSALANP